MVCSHQLIFYAACGHREGYVSHDGGCDGGPELKLPEGMPEPDFPIYTGNADQICQNSQFDIDSMQFPCSFCRDHRFHAGTLSAEAIGDRKEEWREITRLLDTSFFHEQRRAVRRAEWANAMAEFERHLLPDVLYYAAVDAIDPALRSAEAKCLRCEDPLYEKPFHTVQLPCAHNFHLECIHSWIVTRESCSFCNVPFGTHLRLVKRPTPPSFDDPIFQAQRNDTSLTHHVSGYRKFSVVRSEDGCGYTQAELVEMYSHFTVLPPLPPPPRSPIRRLDLGVEDYLLDVGIFVQFVDDDFEWESDGGDTLSAVLEAELVPRTLMEGRRGGFSQAEGLNLNPGD